MIWLSTILSQNNTGLLHHLGFETCWQTDTKCAYKWTIKLNWRSLQTEEYELWSVDVISTFVLLIISTPLFSKCMINFWWGISSTKGLWLHLFCTCCDNPDNCQPFNLNVGFIIIKPPLHHSINNVKRYKGS